MKKMMSPYKTLTYLGIIMVYAKGMNKNSERTS